ncbi:MAG: LysM peptidoglycan-binding domain-containing protein, partial [Anaerolineae bacterium]|nr:LysM peptidoglycan-binding domain-containing protein [Anaerolineae bacterium]
MLVLLLIVVRGYVPTPAAAQSPADEILQRVNALRAALGLPAFTVNAQLMAAAQAHAQWMAAQGMFSHTGAGGSSPQDRATAAGYQGWVAENIVGGSLMDPARGVEWWRNSAIHYATLTSTRYVEVGVGYAYGAGMHMYVLVAGYQSNSAPVYGEGGDTGNGGNTGNAGEEAPPPPAIVIPVEVAEPREDGSIVHVVQAGQTAWDIAAVYGVPLADILRINHLPETPLLVPGDEVIVRQSPNATPVPEGPIYYTVREGDTAWTIAIRYDVALEDLLALNGLPNDPLLLPGEQVVVWLPEGMAPPTPDRPTTYTVQAGDTLWEIAARHNLTMAELLAMNDLSEGAVLLPDTVLTVW